MAQTGGDRTMGEDAETRARPQEAPRATLAGLAPPLAEVPLPAPTAAALLRRNGTDAESADLPALRFGDHLWTHRELLAEAERFAALYRARLIWAVPPMWVFCWTTRPTTSLRLRCGSGRCRCGRTELHPPRRASRPRHSAHRHPNGHHRARHEEQLRKGTEGVVLPAGILVSDRFVGLEEAAVAGESLEHALQAAWAEHDAGGQGRTPLADPDVDALLARFTSGTVVSRVVARNVAC